MHHIRSGFLTLAVTASMLLGASIAVTPAAAGSVIFSFSGDVNNVDSALMSKFNTSNSMTGTMTVNDTDLTPPANAIGTYNITSFDLHIGTYHIQMADALHQVVIEKDSSLDHFQVEQLGNFTAGTGSPIVNFLAPREFEINLRGSNIPTSLFANDSLPSVLPPPSIAAFDNRHTWRLEFGPVGNSAAVSGAMTALAAVPLPPAVILFGAGLVALIGLGARNWQRDARTRLA